MKRSKVVARVAGMAFVLLISSGFTATPAFDSLSESASAVEVVSVSGGTLRTA